jgi:acyl-CoA synthetase (AMP-forming)/AMP-acid ligase II
VRTLTELAVHGIQDARPAIIFYQTEPSPVIVSRAELWRQVMTCAGALDRAGLRAGDLVIIAHTQSLESIYAFWGALVIGAVPSMFPTLTEKLDRSIYLTSMAELTRRSQAKLVLTTDDFAPELSGHIDCPVLSSTLWNQSAPDGEPLNLLIRMPNPQDIAFLQHSSGTTGLQKGVALSHEAVLNQLASYADALDLNENDIVASWLPLYHDMGLIAGFIQPIVQGLPLVLMSPFDWVQHPALLLRAIDETRATLCWLPNFAYNHMARRIRQRDSVGFDLSCMRGFINCSEPVRAASHALFAERFAVNGVKMRQLAVSYAMAENTFAVTQTPISRPAPHDTIDRDRLQREDIALPVASDHPLAVTQVSCGRPIANTRVKIVGGHGDTVGERHVGEVVISSDCMLTGYYRRPDLQPFDADGWYRTGDLGYLADGELYIIGRSKDLIISAGKNVFPQDIEAAAYDVSGIHPGRAVVFGVPDEREGTELIALVAETDESDDAARQRLVSEVRQHIARTTEVSASFVTLVERGWLIKTSSGKTARAANREKWLRERDAGSV